MPLLVELKKIGEQNAEWNEEWEEEVKERRWRYCWEEEDKGLYAEITSETKCYEEGTEKSLGEKWKIERYNK